jgi:outer membrane protein assembly factor BamB
LLYGVAEKGILTVSDAKTGERIERKRLDFGSGRVDASHCHAGGFLFVSSTRGTTLVLRPGREFEQVAKNDFEGFSSSLAFFGERIYIRTSRFLYCVGK